MNNKEGDNKKRHFWQLLFLGLHDEQKEDIALTVVKGAFLTRIYWLELILATIIATFGLLQNSVPVIIGAMLIAPLFMPIQALSFGMLKGQHGTILKALKSLLYSVVVVIGLSFLFSLLIPINYETTEVISRIHPNILDLFIAIFSAMIAFLGLVYKKELSTSIAGVAMAASLLPPLAVVGIEFSMGNFVNAWGSFLLFVTNILAIILVGILLFFFYGFYPHQTEDKKVFQRNILFLLVALLIISIPLVSSLLQINREIVLKSEVRKELSEIFVDNDINVYKLDVVEEGRDKVNVFLGIKLQEGKSFYKDTQKLVHDQLSKKIGRKVDLEIEILRIARIETPSRIDELANGIRTIIVDTVDRIVILDLKVKKDSQDSNCFKVTTVFSLGNENGFTTSLRKDLKERIENKFSNLMFDFTWVPLEQKMVKQVQVKDPKHNLNALVDLKINNYLANHLPLNVEYKIVNVSWDLKALSGKEVVDDDYVLSNVSNVSLAIDFYAPDDLVLNKLNLQLLLKDLKKEFEEQELNFKIRVFHYQQEGLIFTTTSTSLDDKKIL